MSDFNRYMNAQEIRRRAFAEYDAASVKLEKAEMIERMRELISQHEPGASIGIDRDKLRQVLCYIETGRLGAE